MKTVLLIFTILLFGCEYNDLCPQLRELKRLEVQIANDQKVISAILSAPMTDQTINDLDVVQADLEDLLIQKVTIQAYYPCVNQIQ